MAEEQEHKKKSIREMGRDSVEQFRTKRRMPVAVVLDNIRSLNNIGSIFRTSDGFACNELVLCGITATPPSAEIHKTALGAEDSVPWRYFENTLDAIKTLKAEGYIVYSLEQTFNSIPLQDLVIRRGQRYAIVAGHEVDGVDQTVVDASDGCIEIPQSGTQHSFNVSVATALALWEFYKKSDLIPMD